MLSAGGQLFSQREKPFELTKFLEQTCPHSQSIWLRLSAGNENCLNTAYKFWLSCSISVLWLELKALSEISTTVSWCMGYPVASTFHSKHPHTIIYYLHGWQFPFPFWADNAIITRHLCSLKWQGIFFGRCLQCMYFSLLILNVYLAKKVTAWVKCHVVVVLRLLDLQLCTLISRKNSLKLRMS